MPAAVLARFPKCRFFANSRNKQGIANCCTALGFNIYIDITTVIAPRFNQRLWHIHMFGHPLRRADVWRGARPERGARPRPSPSKLDPGRPALAAARSHSLPFTRNPRSKLANFEWDTLQTYRTRAPFSESTLELPIELGLVSDAVACFCLRFW